MVKQHFNTCLVITIDPEAAFQRISVADGDGGYAGPMQMRRQRTIRGRVQQDESITSAIGVEAKSACVCSLLRQSVDQRVQAALQSSSEDAGQNSVLKQVMRFVHERVDCSHDSDDIGPAP
jgi:hypothetical protein